MQTMRKSSGTTQAGHPLDAPQAAESAFEYLHSLFSNLVRPISDPSLEEIEKSKDGRFWLVTLGYSEPRPNARHLPDFLQVPLRKLKVFKVEAATGRVLSMKIPHDE